MLMYEKSKNCFTKAPAAEFEVLAGFTFCPLEVNVYMSVHVGLDIQLTHISQGTGKECNSRSEGFKSQGLHTIKESMVMAS